MQKPVWNVKSNNHNMYHLYMYWPFWTGQSTPICITSISNIKIQLICLPTGSKMLKNMRFDSWIAWIHGSKTRPSRRRVGRVVSVSARSETSPSHESVDSTQRRPTWPRIGVDSVDSALWWWFCVSSQFNVAITTLACIYECSLCNLLYCACILICFYRRRVIYTFALCLVC